MPRAKKRKPLPVGTKGYAKHKGSDYTIEVVATDRGVGYRVGRAVFRSPSSAARFVTGRESNGWVFWHLDA